MSAYDIALAQAYAPRANCVLNIDVDGVIGGKYSDDKIAKFSGGPVWMKCQMPHGKIAQRSIQVTYHVSRLAEIRRRLRGEQPPAGSAWSSIDGQLETFAYSHACAGKFSTKNELLAAAWSAVDEHMWDVDREVCRTYFNRLDDITDCASFLVTRQGGKYGGKCADWKLDVGGATTDSHIWDPTFLNPSTQPRGPARDFTGVALKYSPDADDDEVDRIRMFATKIGLRYNTFQLKRARDRETDEHFFRNWLSENDIRETFGRASPKFGADTFAFGADTLALRDNLRTELGPFAQSCLKAWHPIKLAAIHSWAAGTIWAHHHTTQIRSHSRDGLVAKSCADVANLIGEILAKLFRAEAFERSVRHMTNPLLITSCRYANYPLALRVVNAL